MNLLGPYTHVAFTLHCKSTRVLYQSFTIYCYYWPAYSASIVLLAVVCGMSSSSVVVYNAAGGAGRPAAGGVGVRGRSVSRHYTAGQYGYVLLGRHLVYIRNLR